MTLRVRWLFVHTVGVQGDTTMRAIRRYHVMELGWRDAGYHAGVSKQGLVEQGRPLSVVGAHVRGANQWSLGVVCYGHGDLEPLTRLQRIELVVLLYGWQLRYRVPTERVLGHWEINRLIDQGHFHRSLRTTKSCPGRLIDMDDIRRRLEIPDPTVLLIPWSRKPLGVIN